MTLGDGVSANRLNIIDDGHVLIEPRYYSAALKQRHGGSVGVGSNSSKLTVYLREFGIYILEYVVAAAVGCGMCGS
jgi:hypothetical protein